MAAPSRSTAGRPWHGRGMRTAGGCAAGRGPAARDRRCLGAFGFGARAHDASASATQTPRPPHLPSSVLPIANRHVSPLGYTRLQWQTQPAPWIPRFRASARPLHALLHRDVGALQLLRDARAAHPLHDGVGPPGGLGLRYGHRRGHLRALHLDGVHDHAARRVDRGSPDRPAAGGALRRHHHRLRPLLHGLLRAVDVLPRAVPHRHRHGAAEGERQRHRRTPLREGRHPPRRRVLDLLHGDQSRRVHRAARVRLSRPERQLAHGICRRRRRHDARRHPVRARRPRTSATPASIPRRRNRRRRRRGCGATPPSSAP